jgi:hypothetical protein
MIMVGRRMGEKWMSFIGSRSTEEAPKKRRANVNVDVERG